MVSRRYVFAAAFALGAFAGAAVADHERPAARPVPAGAETAVFAGGCVWCMEADFDALPGVVATDAGTAGADPADILQAVKVVYDPAQVFYRALVDAFFRSVDPLDAGGQFCDRGPSYRAAVFVSGPGQRVAAEAAKAAADAALGAPTVTPILDAAPFTPAARYNQDYAQKNALKYRFYRWTCGRDARLDALWGARRG